MAYMLVLQWSASEVSDYDALIAIEDSLEASITGGAVVDGHDMGSGEMNIFVETNDPTSTFREAEAALGSSPLWTGVRAAFREVGGEEYKIIWPPDLQTFAVA
jgi:hypothetical protein